MTLLVFTILGIVIFIFTILILGDDLVDVIVTTLIYGAIVMTVIALKSAINQEDNDSTNIKHDTSQVIIQDTVKDTSIQAKLNLQKGEITMDIRSTIMSMIREQASEYHEHAIAEVDEVNEWEELQKELRDLTNQSQILKAKTDLFWANLERKYGLQGRAIRIENGKIWVREEKTIEELKESEDLNPADI